MKDCECHFTFCEEGNYTTYCSLHGAAEELLEAAIEAVDLVDCSDGCGDPFGHMSDCPKYQLQQAIKKAKGN